MSRNAVLLSERLNKWRLGGPYPYDTKSPKLHRAASVLTGLSWMAGIAFARPSFVVKDGDGWLQAENRPFIGVLWHKWCAVSLEFVHRFVRQRQVWLNLQEAKMGPTHHLCCLYNIELALTSQDDSKQNMAAVAFVAEELSKGSTSTICMPDGPSGPPYSFKSGALHMALLSGAPILPLHVQASGMMKLSKAWDQKEIQYPGAKIHVTVGTPVFVRDRSEFDVAKDRIIKQMDSPNNIFSLI